VDRRSFLNRATLGALSVFAVGLGQGSLAYLWPNRAGSTGGEVAAGSLDEVLQFFEREGKPLYNAEGRFYLVPYDTSDPSNPYVAAGVAAGGVMALYQRCAHLGCRVPFCESSGWFECPCHGSRYNIAGAVTRDPAATGLSRFRTRIEDGQVVVDTSQPLAAPPGGSFTINQPPAGPFCREEEEGSQHQG